MDIVNKTYLSSYTNFTYAVDIDSNYYNTTDIDTSFNALVNTSDLDKLEIINTTILNALDLVNSTDINATIDDANLVPRGTDQYDNASSIAIDNMIANYTTGVDNISAKIPTILLIAAVVLLFGAIVLLVARSRQMTQGGGSQI